MLDLAHRYVTTLVDFLRLRPRRFFVERDRDPSQYLSPYGFLAYSLGIGSIILVATFSLSLSENLRIAGEAALTSDMASALATKQLTYLLFVLVLNSVFFRAISKFWPVRGSATILSIFQFQCYFLAIVLPLMALDLLLVPSLIALVHQEIVPEWAGSIPAAIDFTIGILGAIVWQIPGVAVVNGVSTRRVWAGFLFWPATLGVGIGLLNVASHVLLGHWVDLTRFQ